MTFPSEPQHNQRIEQHRQRSGPFDRLATPALWLLAARRAREKTPDEKSGTIDYWVGRFEFGVGYFDTIESVRCAATAEKANKPAEAHEHAEDALAKARTALEAYARVARDQSDRGAIATMNEYVYRPLKAKTDEMATLP